MAETFDRQLRQLVFWSAVILLISMFVSFALPLDAPAGSDHATRSSWLLENRPTFIIAWINQIIAMVALTFVLGGYAWQVKNVSPLAAGVGALVLLTSFVAFIIAKFIAVWTIPLLAKSAAGGALNAEMSDVLLRLLNITASYSLFTSFDYLGFWMYALFGLVVASPLIGRDRWSTMAGLTLGSFGVLYHLVVAAVLLDAIESGAIEGYAMSVSVLLVLATFAALGLFRASNAEVRTTAKPNPIQG